ncbi:MAG TPA: hypothetical protein VL282_09475 [Tepidisphaeraceae bacterium]|nr:hypothetical protein [Tepidisphaeraceae bacterium]
MTRIGCGIWLILFAGLPIHGGATAIRHHTSPILGLGWGLATWLALVSGWMVALWFADLLARKKVPPENDVPKWVVPLAWLTCLAMTLTSVWLWRRMRGG